MVTPGYEGPYLLGIDFGTESCRAALYDVAGHALSFAATPYPTYHPRPGRAEQDPADWWRAVQASVHRVMNETGIPARHIAGISYDATTLTMVAMDESGHELGPALMWMDVRATEQAARAQDIEHWARAYTGGGAMPATAEWYPFKAAWLKENEPDIYRRAHRLVDAPDWVTYKLTGEWTCNINTASIRMYYNRDQGGWPVDFYEHIGCGDVFEKLPERVADLGTPLGGLTTTAAHDLGLLPGTPVAQGCGDAWAGQIGLGVVEPGKTAVITGSSQVITGQSTEPVHGNGFFGAYTDAVIPGQYTAEGALVSSGSVLKWFKDNYCRDVTGAAERLGLNPYAVLDERAKNIPVGSNGLIINEYFQGNRSPYSDSKARGIVWGLTLGTTPEDVYHAIMEAVCYGTATVIKAFEAADFHTTELVVCGGATNSRDWMQMHADVTGLPVVLTEVGDAVALGSCILAAVGGSQYESIPDAARNMVREKERIEPRAEVHEEYQFYVEKYMQTYPRLQDLSHEMADHTA